MKEVPISFVHIKNDRGGILVFQLFLIQCFLILATFSVYVFKVTSFNSKHRVKTYLCALETERLYKTYVERIISRNQLIMISKLAAVSPKLIAIARASRKAIQINQNILHAKFLTQIGKNKRCQGTRLSNALLKGPFHSLSKPFLSRDRNGVAKTINNDWAITVTSKMKNYDLILIGEFTLDEKNKSIGRKWRESKRADILSLNYW